MDKDRVKGSFKQFSGAIKEAAGKIVGSKELEVNGKAEQLEGEIQSAAGNLKDTVRESLEKE